MLDQNDTRQIESLDFSKETLSVRQSQELLKKPENN